MDDIKSKIEALLYCMPEGVTTRTIAKLVGTESAGKIKQALSALQKEYSERNSGIRITQNGEFWKFRIRDDLNPLITAAAEPELNKAVLETLAYIAWKKEILQSDLVKARSTKAYDHVKALVSMELISSEKQGVSKLLKPTRKFYKYFNLNEDQTLDFEKLLKEESKLAEEIPKELETNEEGKDVLVSDWDN